MMCDLIKKNFRPLPGNPQNLITNSTIEFARSIGHERARQLLESHIRELPQESWGYKNDYDPIWENRDDRNVFRSQRVRLSATTSDIDERTVGEDLHVTFRTPSPDFLDDKTWYGHATWANVIQLSRIIFDDDLATVYPSNSLSPSFPRLRLSGWSAISREGWYSRNSIRGFRNISIYKLVAIPLWRGSIRKK